MSEHTVRDDDDDETNADDRKSATEGGPSTVQSDSFNVKRLLKNNIPNMITIYLNSNFFVRVKGHVLGDVRMDGEHVVRNNVIEECISNGRDVTSRQASRSSIEDSVDELKLRIEVI